MADGLDYGYPAVFLKTTDGGNSWLSMNDSSFGHYSRNMWWEVDFLDVINGFFFASGTYSGSLWKTGDSGQNWERTALNVGSIVLKVIRHLPDGFSRKIHPDKNASGQTRTGM